MTLVRAVAEGKAHINCLSPNMVFLNSLAKSYKDTLNLPGVKSVGEDNLSTRRDY